MPVKRFGKRLVRSCLNLTGRFIMRQHYLEACTGAEEKLRAKAPQVSDYLAEQGRTGGFHHPHSAFKMLELLTLLGQHQPRLILELGGGATTAAFAHYAREHGGVRVVSIDESQDYQAETISRLPAELRECVTFLHAPRVRDGSDFYYELPESIVSEPVLDFLYVDGPTCGLEVGFGACVDAIRLCDSGCDVRSIVYDNRFLSVSKFLASPFADLYEARVRFGVVDPRTVMWPVGETLHHSVFSKRSIRESLGDPDSLSPRPGGPLRHGSA